jgi:hypothetical protein
MWTTISTAIGFLKELLGFGSKIHSDKNTKEMKNNKEARLEEQEEKKDIKKIEEALKTGNLDELRKV